MVSGEKGAPKHTGLVRGHDRFYRLPGDRPAGRQQVRELAFSPGERPRFDHADNDVYVGFTAGIDQSGGSRLRRGNKPCRRLTKVE